MNIKNKLFILSFIVSGVINSASIFAQNTEQISPKSKINWNNYDFTLKLSPWLESKNSAGLLHLPVNNISNVKFDITKFDGGLRNYFESDNSLTFSVSTSSLNRLNDKVVVTGSCLSGTEVAST